MKANDWAKAVETGFVAEEERAKASVAAHRAFLEGVLTLEALEQRCEAAYARYSERCRAAWSQYDEKAVVLSDAAALQKRLWDSDREAAQESLATLDDLLETLESLPRNVSQK